MHFHEAVDALERGLRVKRTAWAQHGTTIEVSTRIEQGGHLVKVTDERSLRYWHPAFCPTIEDLTAKDWEIHVPKGTGEHQHGNAD
jgi:hypothetical protein